MMGIRGGDGDGDGDGDSDGHADDDGDKSIRSEDLTSCIDSCFPPRTGKLR